MGRYRKEKNLDELHLYAVGVNFPAYEYNIVKEFIQGDSDSSGIRKIVIGRILDKTLPHCLYRDPDPLNPADRGTHMVMIRMTKEEYDLFCGFADQRHFTLSECAIRLIFGWEDV